MTFASISSSLYPHNVAKTYGEMFRNNVLTDVTLICHDKIKIEAHKAVLCSGSKVLQDYLVSHPHASPMLFFHAIKEEHLKPLIEFMYFGQTMVPQASLQKIIEIAKELEIRDLLDDDSEDDIIPEEQPHSKEVETSVKVVPGPVNIPEITPITDTINNCSQCEFKGRNEEALTKHINLLHPNPVKSEKQNVAESLPFNANDAIIGTQDQSQIFSNNYELIQNTELKTVEKEIVSIKTSNNTINQCTQCEFKGRNKAALTKHINLLHSTSQELSVKKSSFDCTTCNFKFRSQEAMVKHNELLHKGA